MKTAFFYRTIDEYNKVQTLISEMNSLIKQRKKVSYDAMSVYTKYLDGKNKSCTNIPKHNPGKKKYLAVVRANKSVLDSVNINVPALLIKQNLQLAPKVDCGPKYKGKKTIKNVILQTRTELLAIVSAFDKAFGHGNWRISGPKHMQKILKNIELTKHDTSTAFMSHNWYENKYKHGVPAKIIVNQEDADINKYLFKVKLKV